MDGDVIKTKTKPEETPEGEVYTTIWDGLSLEHPEGAACDVRGMSERMLQVYGQFGGADVVIHGSLGGNEWIELDQIGGPDIVPLAKGVRFIKPKLVNPTSETKLTVLFTQRRVS